jgi:hypothetical protein
MTTTSTAPAPGVLRDLVTVAAEKNGVCVRPLIVRRTDNHTGQTKAIGIRCGTTRAQACRPCAERNRAIRRDQAREGWHLSDEPDVPAIIRTPSDQPRRVRSTRRRQDAPDLPKVPMATTTLGRTFDTPDGKTFRPSLFVTLTMPSYGKVGPDGAPLDPRSYDYRRAARDAIHFGELVDRFWQNLRRACGWPVQYFAAVEPQRRLAPHLHAAIRGTMPRVLIRQVVAATYHQVWWPPHDREVYPRHRLPVWDDGARGYIDPRTGAPLTTWEEALNEIDDDPAAIPAHVIRFGRRGLDIQGVVPGTKRAGGCLTYLVKYLTKAVAECHEPATGAAVEHERRLTEELRWTPCSSRCANWLLYGVQPEGAHAELVPGCCPGKAHRRHTLGYAGRRCLVSRKWTGKKLDDYRDARRAHVMRALGAIGIRVDRDTDEDPDHTRYSWALVGPNDPDPPDRIELLLRAIHQRRRWRAQYDRARSATDDHDQRRTA